MGSTVHALGVQAEFSSLSVQNVYPEPIMCINNGICNYLSRVAIIPQNQQPELKHVPPKDIWGSILGQLHQALIYHMVSDCV